MNTYLVDVIRFVRSGQLDFASADYLTEPDDASQDDGIGPSVLHLAETGMRTETRDQREHTRLCVSEGMKGMSVAGFRRTKFSTSTSTSPAGTLRSVCVSMRPHWIRGDLRAAWQTGVSTAQFLRQPLWIPRGRQKELGFHCERRVGSFQMNP